MVRPTIGDVAARAGVSVTTVSHTLSGHRAVSPATATKVRAAVEELGYRPSQVARSLRTRRTHTIALVVPDIANPYYPVVARGLHDAMAGHGYYTVTGSTDGEHDAERGLLQEVAARSVDGIVLFSFALEPAEVVEAVGRTPVVLVSDLSTSAHDQVLSEDTEGARAATEHLLNGGMRDIAFLSGPKGLGPGERRHAGWAQALSAAGVSPAEDDVVRGDYTVAGGRAAAVRLLARHHPPRAVLCANDLMAIGVLAAAREAGLRVPEDLAVVGFDNIDAASLVTPALTTVLNPAYDIGRASGDLLVDRLVDGFAGPARSVRVPTRLIVRASG